MEVKIGVQNVAREIVLESDQSAEEVEKLVTTALADGGTLSLVDGSGRRVIVPVADARLRRHRRGPQGQRRFRHHLRGLRPSTLWVRPRH